jgi:hypothetical protein
VAEAPLSEALVVLTEGTTKVTFRWHGGEPRRIRLSIGDVSYVSELVLQPDEEEVIITSHPPSDFDRALTRLFLGDVRVIGDEGEAG